MDRIKTLVAAHKWAIILALLASFLVVLPQLYFRFEHRDDGVYQGIEFIPDSPWSARMREVMDGHPNFGAIYYKDGKDGPYLFQPLGSIVVGTAGKVLGLGVNNTILLSRIMLPFTVFLLVYGCVYMWSRKKMVALSAASLLLLADSILTPSGLIALAQGISPDNFLRMSRPINPAMLYVTFFGFLAAFWVFFKHLDWRWGVAAAVFLGLNFYNYFWSWTFLYAFGGIFGLILLLRKEWRQAAAVAAVYAGGLLVGIPYALNLYAASHHPNYLHTAMVNGVVWMREPLFVGVVALVALAAFLLFFPRERRDEYFFFLALLLAPFVTLNQQLLTGRILQVNHYHWFFHKTTAIIALLIIVFYLLAKYRFETYQKWLAGLIVVGSIAVGSLVQARSYYPGTGASDGGALMVERQKYGPAMQWFNDHAQKEEVVLANFEASHMVVIYTPLNVYFHRAGMYSLASSKERLLTILFTFYRLRGVGATDAREVFFDERAHLSTNIYGMYYRDLCGNYTCIPDDKVEEILAEYQKTLTTPTARWVERSLKKYEVSYVLWDTKKDPEWRLDRYPFLTKEAMFGDLAIYRTVYE